MWTGLMADPLANALHHADPTAKTRKLLIANLFHDRPDALQAIMQARVEKGLSVARIAKIISDTEKISISEGAVRNWLHAQGIE
jgi:hypothetical protein